MEGKKKKKPVVSGGRTGRLWWEMESFYVSLLRKVMLS